MKPPSTDVKDILEAETDLVFGTDLFIGSEPDTPSNVITLYDTGGGPEDFIRYRQPSIQVRCRNTSYLSGWDQINKVMQTLIDVSSRKIGTDNTYHTAWWLESDIMFIERDAKDRVIFTANLRGHRSD